ncbi:cytochrome c1 [Rhodovibrionaceae bacterium A322]
MKSLTKFAAAALVTLGLASPALAAGDAIDLPQQKWSFSGIFGTYDRDSLQRGYQVYSEVCSGCHSLNYVAYRNLMDLGYNADEVKAIAAEFEVEDGPDDEGEMFTRPALPSDYFVAPFANENAAKASNGGAYPPDLSLMAKARADGANYIYALMTGYLDEAPAGAKEVPEGMYYNAYFPGHNIAMAPPLGEDAVEYADGTAATTSQMAHDVTEFLMWAAEPNLDQRHSTGLAVLIFLTVFTALLYAVKRKVWSKLH